MINKISNIKNMGVFIDFQWDINVIKEEDIVEFSIINILYGRNYSGKTTLSRIIGSLYTKELPRHFENAGFSLLTDGNIHVKSENLETFNGTVQVFNEDFIRKNLSFLSDTSKDEGIISAFAILGEKNIKNKNEIIKLKEKLGCNVSEQKTGYYSILSKAQEDEETLIKGLNEREDQLDKLKKYKATDKQDGIKYHFEKFGDQNYSISKMNADIVEVLSDEYVDVDRFETTRLEKEIKEERKNEIIKLNPIDLKYQVLKEKTIELIGRKIGTSKKIQEMVREHALNDWAKKGYELHKEKHDICAFCGNAISKERWIQLGEHFNEETETLEKEIDSAIKSIEGHKNEVAKCKELSYIDIYIKFAESFTNIAEELGKVITDYIKQLNSLVEKLNVRRTEITKEFEYTFPAFKQEVINGKIQKLNDIIVQANEYSLILEKNKGNAKKKLRLHEVYSFLKIINYSTIQDEINAVNIKIQENTNKKRKVQDVIGEIEKQILKLEKETNSEELAAEKINALLKSSGNDSLSLQANLDKNENDNINTFEIIRNNKKAFNLSEGERRLIAFCYFLIKVEALQEGIKPIIWIDDPISSLDSNHIFLVYSLIRTHICEKNNFEQLFISTHNLEFLKYLKRLPNLSNKKKKRWFIVERQGNKSCIKVMPKYMENYITEFNYLFEQIYICANSAEINDANFHLYYNFGNNARKFLELYLYYKFPDGISDKTVEKTKLHKFFGNEINSYMIDRVNNEMSHMAGSFERGETPVEITEIKHIAKLIVDKIKEADSEQYNAFVASISVNKTISN